MVRFHYTQSAAGVPAGFVKPLPDSLAAELVKLGIGYVENKPVTESFTPKAANSATVAGSAAKTSPKRAKSKSSK